MLCLSWLCCALGCSTRLKFRASFCKGIFPCAFFRASGVCRDFLQQCVHGIGKPQSRNNLRAAEQCHREYICQCVGKCPWCMAQRGSVLQL